MYKKHISLYPKIMVRFFHAGVDGIRRAENIPNQKDSHDKR